MTRPRELARDGAALEGRERDAYVHALFDDIARPYDRLNRVISLGRDRAWRRRVVRLSGVGPGGRVCDLGTGTGDLALAFADVVGPEGIVVGVDVSSSMLGIAARKAGRNASAPIRLVRGSATRTGLPDGFADAVCMGWVLRNVGDRPPAYAEILRLLRPGGRFVTVDMSRPPGRVRALLARAYCHVAIPSVVRLLGGDRSAYTYLARSIDRFPAAAELSEELREAGFRDVRHHSLMLGSLAIHVAVRP